MSTAHVNCFAPNPTKHEPAVEAIASLILANERMTFTELCRWTKTNRPEVQAARVPGLVINVTKRLEAEGRAKLVRVWSGGEVK